MFETLFNKTLSRDARYTFLVAQQEAIRLKSAEVGECHLLLALMQGPLNDVFRHYGAELDAMRLAVRVHEKSASSYSDLLKPSESLRKLVEHAAGLAGVYSHKDVEVKHLFKALMTVDDSEDSVKSLMRHYGLDVRALEIKADILLKLLEPTLGDPLGTMETPRGSPFVAVETFLTVDRSKETSAENSSKKRVTQAFFTADMESLIAAAQSNAREFQEEYISVERLLATLAKSELRVSKYAKELLALEGVARRTIERSPNTAPSILKGVESTPTKPLFTEEAVTALNAAWNEVWISGEDAVSPEHLLLGILRNSEVIDLFLDCDFDRVASLRRQMRAQFCGTSSNAELDCEKEVEEDKQLIAESRDDLCPELPELDIRLHVTARVERALKLAKDEACLAYQSLVQAPHLVLGLIAEAFKSEVEFVKNREFEWEQIRASLNKRKGLPNARAITTADVRFAPEIFQILKQAQLESQRTRMQIIDLNHLAIALLSVENNLSAELGDYSKISIPALRRRLEQCIFLATSQKSRCSAPCRIVSFNFR